MPRNARCVLEGLAYHVTQRGSNRQRVFSSAGGRRTYLGLARESLADARVRVLTYCLMTDVDWVVMPERDDSMATVQKTKKPKKPVTGYVFPSFLREKFLRATIKHV